VQKLDEGRAGGMALQAQRLAEQGILRADVTVDAATGLLCLLTSFTPAVACPPPGSVVDR